MTTTATKQIPQFTVLAAKERGGRIRFEAPHTSDPTFDAAVVLLKPIVQISARPMPGCGAN